MRSQAESGNFFASLFGGRLIWSLSSYHFAPFCQKILLCSSILQSSQSRSFININQETSGLFCAFVETNSPTGWQACYKPVKKVLSRGHINIFTKRGANNWDDDEVVVGCGAHSTARFFCSMHHNYFCYIVCPFLPLSTFVSNSQYARVLPEKERNPLSPQSQLFAICKYHAPRLIYTAAYGRVKKILVPYHHCKSKKSPCAEIL